jgi:transcriptional regulator with XRE-family HTH domain
MNFREQIKKICKQKGITQKELAAKLNIQAISLHQTLRGQYPQLQTLERIAAALDVHITELFEHPEAPAAQDVSISLKLTCPNCNHKITLNIKK